MCEILESSLPESEQVDTVGELTQGHRNMRKTLSRPRLDSERIVMAVRLHSVSLKEDTKSTAPRKLDPLTRKEYFQIISFVMGNFCLGTIYALMAPFFPNEAEKKDLSPFMFGFVFGIFEFGKFIFGPVMAILIPFLSPKYVIYISLFITGFTTVVFGILEWCAKGWPFFWCAIILRGASSIGACGFLTASFTVIATKFQTRTAQLFSITEVSFGFGMIVGPSIGGVLFEVGGFSVPFFSAGSCCILASIISFFSFPNEKLREPRIQGKRVGMISLACNMGVFINIFIAFVAFINIGFLDASLEPHLREFTTMTPSQIGAIFLIAGGIYVLATPIWGHLIQRLGHAYHFMILGFVLSALCFLIAGPMWPIPVAPSLVYVIVAIVLYGLSMGPQLVGSFTSGLTETIRSGYQDNIETLAAMSSLYQSSCALGAAIGPVLGGYLLETMGYAKAVFFIFFIQIIMIVIITIYIFYDQHKDKREMLALNLALAEAVEESKGHEDIFPSREA